MKTRRDFLSVIGSIFAGAWAFNRLEKVVFPDAEAASPPSSGNSPSGRYAELAKTASDCIRTGEACKAHCAKQLAKGNTEFGKCDRRVSEMLSLTRAMLTLASMESELTPKVAALCAIACKNCSEACAEHKQHFSHGMHLQCKACMEACDACVTACHNMPV